MQCLRCNKEFTEKPAISRVDNKSLICSSCRVEESMWDFSLLTFTKNNRIEQTHDRLILLDILIDDKNTKLMNQHFIKIKNKLLE